MYLLYLLIRNSYQKIEIKIKEKRLRLLLADSYLKKAIGLMYRDNIPYDGMLFLFNKPSKAGIFMLNMRFPINIFWLNEKGIIFDRKINAKPCNIFNCTTYVPRKKAKFVIETKVSNKFNIGDKAYIPLFSTK